MIMSKLWEKEVVRLNRNYWGPDFMLPATFMLRRRLINGSGRSRGGSSASFADAAYYANWLSIVYGLKDRRFKNLLVFLPKIEDLTLFFVTCLKTEGKRGKSPYFVSNPPLRKNKAYRWFFRRLGLQNQRCIHGFASCLLRLVK